MRPAEVLAEAATGPSVLLAVERGVARLTLNRPERHNALVPEIAEQLEVALGALPDGLVAVVLGAAGRSFSTGGDVAAFHRAACDSPAAARAYADRLVGSLHRSLLRLVGLPVPVLARVQGPATGGACGLLFVADIVIMADGAFLQPYYSEVGFAPDGGWTAALPERIGPARAFAIQAANRRVHAEEAVSLGIAEAAVPPAALDRAVEERLESLRGKDPGAVAAARHLIWDAARRQRLAERLDAEKAGFLERIGLPETRAGMQRFLAGIGKDG